MHQANNDHRYLWILGGTGEGPILAKALIDQGWKISVSVVSEAAALSYEHLSLEDIWIGPIDGIEGISRILNKAKVLKKKFDWVIDATHPFALVITSDLQNACAIFGQPLLRFDRPVFSLKGANLINTTRELANQNLKDRNLLLAIGSRHLKEAVGAARIAGANVFVRILPNPSSFVQAISCPLSETQVAMFRPLGGTSLGELELALCKKWSIDYVVCRQSGGVTQETWQQICGELKIDLCLVRRPLQLGNIEVVNSVNELVARVSLRK